ncbi:VanW family protein [Cohnella sp. AR92]|uniref:VanW family protein n=1 Tax=Cohnella sp. AR92 TaxID=648716 RepID=UPI000F8E56B3|nr:VanW family protein [Cohnella sp. AR92]RUS45802.1 vancomycin resistance protein [Cohnella sp. AR92]
MRPIMRSKLRVKIGTIYYRNKRYLEWLLGGYRFAKPELSVSLPHPVFKHQTPLLRRLKDVEMWLQYNKIQNLRLAIDRINQVVIHPGETFSYWKLIGNPTRRKGYVEGMVLYYGGFKPGVGGGLCQLSNLIYWTALHTPLQVTERHRHSYDVFPDANRTQPFGSGATCAYNYLDLRIYNPTDVPYQFMASMDADSLMGEWRAEKAPLYRYEIYEKDHRMTSEPWGGYTRHNAIYRRKYNLDGEMVGDEWITENHALMMYQPFLKASASLDGDDV